MTTVELSAGPIEYEDTGTGPTLVLLHGMLMDGSLWDGSVADLSADHRCVVPTLPLGAHRQAMHADADLSLPAVARLVIEFLDRLDLRDVTLVGSDTGGALVQLVMAESAAPALDPANAAAPALHPAQANAAAPALDPAQADAAAPAFGGAQADGPALTLGAAEADGAARISRVVLVSCDAFDNFPPGLTGKTLVLTGRLSPRMFGLFMQQMRLRPVRRLPIAFGRLTKRGDTTTARWTKPVLSQPAIRRDTVRMLRAAAADTGLLTRAAEALPSFDRPALVVWARDDRVMPPDHGRRLAGLLPRGRLVEVDDSDTLIPLDQPVRLAQILREFRHSFHDGAMRAGPKNDLS